MRYKSILALLLATSVVFVGVYADTYGYTTVLFNVPTDTNFRITMPGDGSGCDITSDSAEGTQTGSWISFNATAASENYVQPQTNGSASNIQDGLAVPIFQIENIGNTDINISLQWDTANNPDACIAVDFIAVCEDGGCTGAAIQTANTTVPDETAYELIAGYVNVGDIINVSMFANFTSCQTTINTDTPSLEFNATASG